MTTSQLYSQLLVLITTDESIKLRPLQKDHRSRIKISLKDGFILPLFSGCFNVGSEASISPNRYQQYQMSTEGIAGQCHYFCFDQFLYSIEIW